jgi:hypothetical protein
MPKTKQDARPHRRWNCVEAGRLHWLFIMRNVWRQVHLAVAMRILRIRP